MSTLCEASDDTVQRIQLLRTREVKARLTTAPFVVLYAGAAYAFLYPAAIWGDATYEAYATVLDFAHAVLIPLVGLLHAVFVLLTIWIPRIGARVNYVSAGISDATHALVETRPHRGESKVVPLTRDNAGRTLILFQQIRFTYDPRSRIFARAQYPDTLTFRQYSDAAAAGGLFIGASVVANAEDTFGRNDLTVQIPSFQELLIDHMLAPFFVFQMFCVLLWCLDEYWMVALMNGFMMLGLECTVVMQRQRSMRAMHDMGAVPVIDVPVRRGGAKAWTFMGSTRLLPGDVVLLPSNVAAPVDMVLVKGTAVVNEAMLTGESTPQMKEHVPTDADSAATEFSMDRYARHAIFAGTQIVSTTGATESVGSKAVSGAICVVVRTGFETKQGQLMRTIAHSQSRVSENSGEAFGFIALLLVFAIAASSYVLRRGLDDPGKSRWKLFLTCTQILTSVVPPELPMQLSLAVNTSLMSLMKLRVFCTEPFRIPFAGKVDTCCFDKTGTLTTDEMLFTGIDSGTGTPSARNVPLLAEYCAATCHSLVVLPDGTTAGDAMEKAAVDALGWKLKGADDLSRADGKQRLNATILHRYPFDPALRRMSCIVKVGSAVYVVAKGSPESISGITAAPIAAGPMHVAHKHAAAGLRVIALAVRSIAEADVAAAQAARGAAERDLDFCGFAVYECPLKKDATETIRQLIGGSHRCVMITGDSFRTALAVARQVTMAACSTAVVAVEVGEAVHWAPLDPVRLEPLLDKATAALPTEADACVDGETLTDAGFQRLVASPARDRVVVWARCAPQHKESIVANLRAMGGAVVLMAGDGTNDVGGLKQAHVGVAVLNSASFQPAADAASAAPKPAAAAGAVGAAANGADAGPPPQPGPNAGFMDHMRFAVANAKYQAEKQRKEQMERQRAGQAGAPTAPKAAGKPEVDAGMTSLFNSMDEEDVPMVKLGDASIAAPFTSKSKKLTAICDIVRLGRCTLVTTLQMYKILALNCLVASYTMAVLFSDGVKFSQSQMVSSGLVMTVCFLLLSRSTPLPTLSPQRPITRVFHPYMMVSIFGQFAVHLYSLSQSVALVQGADPSGVASQEGDEEADFSPTLLNSIVFLMTTLMSVTTFAVNFKGRPFMTGLRESRAMMIMLGGLTLIVLVCASEVDPEFNELFEIKKFPSEAFRHELLSLLAIDALGSWAVETVAFAVLGRL